jgi:N-formylglutamate amidohydrolase
MVTGELSTDAGAMRNDAPSAPFALRRSERLTTPLVFASPHSGRFYPDDMMQASYLDAAAIRRSEDVLVDALVGSAGDVGAPLLAARYARAYIDVNREPYELDQSMFEDALPAFAATRTARVAAGLGSIARVVSEGQEIYRRKLTFGEARHRIETVHRPYHQALQALLDEAHGAFGAAILIDWHSMPSTAARCDAKTEPVRGFAKPFARPRGSEGAPDFVLGDRFGASCSYRVVQTAERILQDQGYRVARNAPYAGGHTTEFYGRPAKGVHALQIEINRGLYLNETTLEPSEGFSELRANLGTMIAALVRTDWSGL